MKALCLDNRAFLDGCTRKGRSYVVNPSDIALGRAFLWRVWKDGTFGTEGVHWQLHSNPFSFR